jgi:hypothetical protein
MLDGYSLLIQKLDEFTRKYYKNQIIRGALYSVAIILGFFLLITILEYFGRFSSDVRTLFFWLFILSSGFVLVKFILIPLLKLLRLGKQISHEQAAKIIGTHFKEVEDKLLNTLQLKELAIKQPQSRELIEASIDQKIAEMRPVPFTAAIDLGQNRKYLRYAIPPVAVIIILLFAAPSILKEGTDRLVRHSEEISEENPFQWTIVNESLAVPENQSFELKVDIGSNEVPDKLYLILNGSRFKFNQTDKSSFSYVFRNVRSDMPFQLYADGFYSEEFVLEAIPVPGLLQFAVQLDYPGYTGKIDETLQNTGDLNIPAGTVVKWTFQTKNTNALRFITRDSLLTLQPQGENRFSQELRCMQNTPYSLLAMNNNQEAKDSISYQIRVIPDRFPSIIVDEEKDSISDKHLYFTGEVGDDYGFRRLSFNYRYTSSEVEGRVDGELKSIDLRLNPGATAERFFYHWDLNGIELNPGDEISYYFEIWDNDGVNGSKSSRSAAKLYAAPTLDELEEKIEEKNDEIKDELEKGIKEAKDLQKELDELKRQMLEKEELDWKDRKKLEELLEKQKNLQQTIQDINQKNEQKEFSKQEFMQTDPELLEKQQKLQELFDQLMSEEMKKMYEDLQKMMDELNKDEIQEQLQKMEMSPEDIEKEMDRALEQFKQMEFEQKMEETIDKLKELAEKQEKLAEDSEKGQKNSEALKEQQDELNKEFEQVKEDLKKLNELNEQLEDPNRVPNTEQQQEEIKQDMQKSSEELSKDKQKKASESQKDAAEKMEQMAQQMEASMEQSESESAEQDMDDLRDLLENIITLSFDQEQLMQNFKTVEQNDPKYVQYGQKQRKLQDDTRMVEDSLYALAKRVIQIEPIVLREIGAIKGHMESALDEIAERQTPKVTENQQYVMTSFNNLALLLDEALKQMQQDMANKQPGTGNCEKPGGNGSKPSASQMKKMQEALSKQLEQMKEQMGKNGEKGKSQQQKPGMSQEIAKMAAKQAAIRQQIEQMSQQLNEDGSKSGNGLKEIAKEMEELEKDLVNMRVDEATMKRQQDILIRLLEAENAERQREMDEKRKSNEAIEQKFSNPMRYSEYKEQKERETELLRTMPPALKPYYKERVNEYFNKLGEY